LKQVNDVRQDNMCIKFHKLPVVAEPAASQWSHGPSLLFKCTHFGPSTLCYWKYSSCTSEAC